MKKKTVRIVLAAALAISMLAGCIGCSKTEEPKEDVKKDAVKEESVEKLDDVKELLKYVPKADKVKIVENAKDLDMDKILMDAVDEKQKSQVKEIQCDVKEVDFTKKGTYTVPVTLTLKESADSKDTAKAEEKNPADASKDTKDTETVKDEKAKKPASEKTVIQTEIKIEVVSKEKVKELAEKGNLVIQADGKVAKAETKEKDAEKKDSDKKEESKKTETSAENKANDTSTANNNNGNTANTGNTSTGGGETYTPPAETPAPSTPDNNTGGGGYVPPAQEQPAPTPPPVNHTWAPEMAEQQVWVEDYVTVLLCGCGAQFNDFASWNQHSIDGCDFGYSVTEIPGGGHYETQWVETGRYYCTSCGAYQ